MTMELLLTLTNAGCVLVGYGVAMLFGTPARRDVSRGARVAGLAIVAVGFALIVAGAR